MVSVTGPAHPDTVYAATCELLPPTPPLSGSASADVCIIGAGFTGLAAALHLARAGRKVIVVDQGRIGSGASGRTGGQASVGMRLKQDTLERLVGVNDARQLWQVALDAMAHLKGLMAEGGDCDFTPGVVRLEHRPASVPAAHRYAEKMRRDYGFDALEPLDRAGVMKRVATEAYAGGLYDSSSGHLHPVKLSMGIARLALAAGAVIHEGATVTGVVEEGDHSVVHTTQGRVRAGHVIYAGNGMMTGLDGGIDNHIMPIRNFILATEPLSPAVAESLIAGGAAASDTRFIVYYFRVTKDRRLVFGGGETYSYRDPADMKGFVRRHMLRIYPQLAQTHIDYAWGGTIGITRTRMPYFRRIGARGLVAGGFSGRGIVLAPYAGKLLADAITGRSDQFELLARIQTGSFPGGPAFRSPLLVAGMVYGKLRDMIG